MIFAMRDLIIMKLSGGSLWVQDGAFHLSICNSLK